MAVLFYDQLNDAATPHALRLPRAFCLLGYFSSFIMRFSAICVRFLTLQDRRNASNELDTYVSLGVTVAYNFEYLNSLAHTIRPSCNLVYDKLLTNL